MTLCTLVALNTNYTFLLYFQPFQLCFLERCVLLGAVFRHQCSTVVYRVNHFQLPIFAWQLLNIDRYTQFFSQYKMVLLLQQYFILIEKLRISIDICHTKMGSWKWRTLYIDHDRVCVRYVYLYVCSFWDKNGIAKSRPTMHFLPNYCE